MSRFTRSFGLMMVVVVILAAVVIAWLQTAHLDKLSPTVVGGPPGPPAEDPYPMLPPMSALARLPSAEVVAEWGKLQRAAMDEIQAKVHVSASARANNHDSS